MLSSWLLPAFCSLNGNVSEHPLPSLFTWKAIVWPQPPTVHHPHPETEPYSLTHLPMASMLFTASTTCFLYLLPPWLLHFEGAQAIFRAKPFHVQYPTFSTAVTLHTCYSPMKMEHTQCSETSTFKEQTPRNNPEDSIRNFINFCTCKLTLMKRIYFASHD
jgi:hypothetical protein